MQSHDEGQTSYWPTRTYRCAKCGALHQYKRALADIPLQSPCCTAGMGRAYDVDGVPGFVMKTPIREVRHKLRQEEREGKRLPAAQRDLNPHFATV